MMKKWMIALVVFIFILASCAPAEVATLEPVDTPDMQGVIQDYTEKTVEALDDRILSLERTVESLLESPTATMEETEMPVDGTPPASGSSNPGDCLRAEFVADITIPDGTIIPPGSPIRKTWAIRNAGSCPWDKTYQLHFLMGSQLGAPSTVPLGSEYVAPGEMVLVSVNMVAPLDKNTYRSYWKLQNSFGTRFGLGDEDAALFMEFNVDNSYDFIENLCSATWHNAEKALFCPGQKDNPDGSFYVTNTVQLESGIIENQPAIILAPQQVRDGQIFARFAPVVIPPGAFLETRIGCVYGYEFCNYNFVITYQVDGGVETTLGEWNEWNDGLATEIGIDLSENRMQGKKIAFNFYVKANGGPEDMAFLQNLRLKVY